jgi:PRC-barrel domain
MATTMTTRWNPTTHADYDLLKGLPVYSRNGDKVGTVKAVFHPHQEMPAARGGHYFLLDPGLVKDWFGGLDEVYLPESAIDLVSADRVDLALTKDDLKTQSWAKPADFDAWRRA